MVEARWKEAHLQKVVKSLPMLDYLKEKNPNRIKIILYRFISNSGEPCPIFRILSHKTPKQQD